MAFSGWQGLRSLTGLAIGIGIIIYFLIPLLLKGYPPVPTSIAISSMILFFAIYLTHGFNKISTVAFSGTIISVFFTGIIASIAVATARLSGLGTEETFYLNLNSGGTLNIEGLILAGIMIGIIGVLDDIAVTQCAMVKELYILDPNMSKKEVYTKALRVGKEHVGALVNTLALAYTGASLPLLLLFYNSGFPVNLMLSQEMVTTEIIRTITGSMGLVATVPITTLLAVFFLRENKS